MSLIGAGILAAGAIGGAVISSDASKSAANAQTNAANSATAVQQGEFNTVNSEQAPSRNLGYGADSILAQLYGIANPSAAGTGALYPAANVGGSTGSPSSLPTTSGYGGIIGSGGANGGAVSPGSLGAAGGVTGSLAGTAAGYNPAAVYSPGGSINPSGAGTSATATGSSPDFSTFYNQPGYQFSLNQGEQAINRGASANGSLYSSSTLGALGNYAAGTASTQYNNYVSQLMQMAGLGQNAANTTSNAAITTGNNISANALSAGNANASGILGSAGAWNSALNGTSNSGVLNPSSYSGLNNPNNNTNMVTYYNTDGTPYQGTVASGGF